MKPFTAILSLLLFLCQCSSPSTDDVKDSIPGTYIREGKQEFGAEWDTLVISLQNAPANEYQVVRRWRYERVLNGEKQAPDYKVTTTIATYDPATKKLSEARTGKTYTLDAKTGVLHSGATEYHKEK